jgi:hypothetical protein
MGLGDHTFASDGRSLYRFEKRPLKETINRRNRLGKTLPQSGFIRSRVKAIDPIVDCELVPCGEK